MKHGPIEAEVSSSSIIRLSLPSVLMKHGPIEARKVVVGDFHRRRAFRADEARPH